MFLITTPIPYTNAEPHLGHLLEGVFNDTIARFYRRVMIDPVNLTMGLDQHGLKIYQKALESGQTPEEFAREQGLTFVKLWDQFEVKYDSFIETSDKYHKALCQILWNRLVHNGFIYKKAYDGLYCVGCEDFYAPSQLTEDGKCPIHHSKPIKMSEENYFFKLSDLGEPIKQFLETADIRPEHVRQEWLKFVEGGLQDVSCTRQKERLPWGIEVPGDPNQVMYVWVDALINYLTASVNPETLDRWIEQPLLRAETEPDIFGELLDALPINIMYISKEIAKFHLVVFIGMLTALGLPLPLRALAHGLINDAEGKKFSKSLGNGVFPHELVEKIGVDGTRFVMLHDINVEGDTNFDWTRILESYNSHLADNIGNLAMRVTTLVEKYLEGLVDYETWTPTLEEFVNSSKIQYSEVEEEIISLNENGDEIKSQKTTSSQISQPIPFDFSPAYTYLNDLKPREALDVLLAGASFGNEVLEKTKPWTLAKEGKDEQVKEILTGLCILLKDLGEILSIFMPASGDRLYHIFVADKIVKAEVLFPKVEIGKE